MAERAEDRFVFIALAADGNGIAEPAYVQVHDPGKVLPAVVLAVQTGHIKPASGTAGFLAVKKGEARRVYLFLQVLCKVNEDAEGGGVIIGAKASWDSVIVGAEQEAGRVLPGIQDIIHRAAGVLEVWPVLLKAV